MKFSVILMLVLLACMAITGAVFAQSCGSAGEKTDATTTESKGDPQTTPATTTTPPTTAPATTPATPASPATPGTAPSSAATPPPKVIAKPEGNPQVILETNYGNITIELFKDKAPISTENFLAYVRDGFYDGTIFHRVVKGFVIQAGGFTPDMKEKEAKPPIKNEAANGLSNLRGTLSVARTSDINSGASHFFINLVDNKRLDHTGTAPSQYGYAVFGKVTGGMDVVDKIAAVEVAGKGGFQDVPVKPVTITKATIVGGQPKAAVKAETKAETKPGELKAEKKQIGETESGTQTK